MTGQQLRVLSGHLYPSTLSNGLIPAFLSFADHPAEGPAVSVEFDDELIRREKADGSPVSDQVKLALYRIAEEALTNATRHADAGNVIVRLDASREGWLQLTVRDDGRGIEAESASAGLGVGTMQDYADNAGGRCVVQCAPDAGTEVMAVLPLLQGAQNT